MAKIGIVGDVHLSRYSSILRSRGKNFSTRLEGLIKSLSWVEKLFEEHNCVEEIFLGDTFDTPDVDAETITALSEVDWNKSSKVRHFIVGNHESGISSLQYNSTQMLYKLGVIENVSRIYSIDDSCEILFLPYITEDNRKPLSEYLTKRDVNKDLIICSHNDIKGFQLGKFISTTGFDVDEIEKNCNLYFNGHLHNCGNVTNKIINIGVLSGMNFNEDAFKYNHHVAIYDTETKKIEYFENPHAFNFYKIEINNEKDINKISTLKTNAVVSFRCLDKYKELLIKALEQQNNIISHKITFIREITSNESQNESTFDLGEDHLEQFRKYIIETLGNNNVVNEELGEVCK